jgi:hypothetical protein
VFHGTLHLTLVHTYIGHFQGLKALCSDFAYSSSDCLHFHGECFQLPGAVFYGKFGGLTANHLGQYRNWERIINVGLLSIPWLKYTHRCVWLYLLCVELTVWNRREVWHIDVSCCRCVISLIVVYKQLLVWSRILSFLHYFELFPIPSGIPERTENMWYLFEQCLEEPKRQIFISIIESLHDRWRAAAHCDMFEITLPMTGELCLYQYNSKKLYFMLRIHVIIKIFVIGGSHSSVWHLMVS